MIGRSFSMLLTFIVLIVAMSVNFAIKFEVKELKPDTSDCGSIEWTKEVRRSEERSDELGMR